MGTDECQFPCLQTISEGNAELPPQSFGKRLKFMIRRRLSPRTERALKMRSNELMIWLSNLMGKSEMSVAPTTTIAPVSLKAGNLIRVRSCEEIEVTLNYWRQLKGYTFMPEMRSYCGTTRRVLKVMERFVDERDLRTKECNGIVLLEEVVCQGTADFGRCDRCLPNSLARGMVGKD